MDNIMISNLKSGQTELVVSQVTPITQIAPTYNFTDFLINLDMGGGNFSNEDNMYFVMDSGVQPTSLSLALTSEYTNIKAGQSGAVHRQPRPHVDHERARVQPLRPGAQLRLLHREHAPGLAQARGPPVDEDPGRRARRRGLRPERGPLPLGRGARDGSDGHRLSVPRYNYNEYYY